MDANSRKKPSQFEINDLIAEAVVNAEARRNQAVELLSDEELGAVKGGYASFGMKVNFPIIAGKFPIIAGNFPIIAGNFPIASGNNKSHI